MAINITLTSSMRSNLSALKSLASQMSTTQTRLATGKKVTKAIDNASSYYQARALNNRASDLDALLDSMGQSIQTISTAVKGLEKSGEMLEQAAVIAEAAYEAAIIPEKAWFEAQVGPNGAVVTTAQELKDAINSGKEIVCVYGKIDYFENQTLTMKANQKLVGTEYFTGYSGNKKFSEINFKKTSGNAVTATRNSLISDLSLNYYSTGSANLIYSPYANINNVDLSNNTPANSGGANGVFYGSFDLHGKININNISGKSVFSESGSSCIVNICDDATVNIKSLEDNWGDAIIYSQSKLNIYGKLNAWSSKGILLGNNEYSGNSVNIYKNAEVTLRHNTYITLGSYKNNSIYNTIYIEEGAKINVRDISGNAYLISKGYIVNNKSSAARTVTSSILKSSGKFVNSGATVDWNNFANTDVGSASDAVALEKGMQQYATVMNSFDEIVEDSSYQGINLITGGSLTTMFNENRTHSFVVQGEDMRAESLGIVTREWNTRDDIAASIKEIKNAMGKVRDMVESLGNNLSIIQTRENFTDKLIDVLEIGADDLVLADMNEESANYLALQTRNNLAVNALALAAQSGNAVLKLF